MATRFRLTNDTTAPAVLPALQTYSHNAPTTVRRKLLTSDSSALATTAYTPDAADHAVAGDSLWCQFVSDGVNAGVTFTSGETIKFAVQGLEAHASNNLNVQLYIAIVDSTGTTVQRILRTKVEDNLELGTALANRFLSTTQSGATYTTVSGDRLVVEFSVEGTPTSGGGTNAHNSSMRFGGAGAGGDLPENDTETGTTFNPWIEFVPSGLFSNPVTVTPSTASLTTATFAPTITASDNQTVTPPTASLALTAFAPTVTATDHQTVTPAVATLSLTTFAPTVSVGGAVEVVPGVAALSLTTFAPGVAVSDNIVVTPGVVALNLAAFAPTVSTTANVTVTAGTVSLTLTGYPPTVSGDVVEEYVGHRRGALIGDTHRGPPPGAMVVVRAVTPVGLTVRHIPVKVTKDEEDEEQSWPNQRPS